MSLRVFIGTRAARVVVTAVNLCALVHPGRSVSRSVAIAISKGDPCKLETRMRLKKKKGRAIKGVRATIPPPRAITLDEATRGLSLTRPETPSKCARKHVNPMRVMWS